MPLYYHFKPVPDNYKVVTKNDSKVQVFDQNIYMTINTRLRYWAGTVTCNMQVFVKISR